MTAPPWRRFSNRLSFKQARLAVLVAIVLGTAVVLVQVWSDLTSERERLEIYGEKILAPVSQSLSRAAFRLDDVVARELAFGLLEDPSVVEVRIVDDFGDTLALAQKQLQDDDRPVFSGLVSGSPVLSSVELIVQPENRPVGRVEVTIDPGIAAAAFSERTALLIVTGITKSVLLAIVLTVLFYWTVTRRIEKMAAPYLTKTHDNEQHQGEDELDDLNRAVQTWSAEREAYAGELERAADRMRLAAKAARLGIWEWRIKDNALFWDEGMHRLYGTDPSTFTGNVEFWSSRLHAEDREATLAALTAALEGVDAHHPTFRIHHTDGSIATIRGAAVVEYGEDDDPVSMTGVNIDVTDEEKLRSDLETSRRVESLGALSAGVAHDFNNLLAVVVGNLEIAEDAAMPKEAQECIEEALRACIQGKSLTSKLLAFGRRSPLHPLKTDANELLVSLIPMLRRTLPETIEITEVLEPNIPPILVDPGLFETSVLNLTINARDAMRDGGRILLTTATTTIDQDMSQSAPHDLAPSRYVRLTLEDTGAGVAAKNVSRIFDPFFSTKEFGQGHGMGLPMVRGFVEQSGGTVRVYSEIGMGTSIQLFFPAADSIEVLQSPEIILPEKGALQEKTVLVVEDNPEVRRAVVRQVTRLGCTPIEADTGQRALDILADVENIDAVLTDVVMSGEIQGLDLACLLEERHGAPPVICMSGYDGRGALSDRTTAESFEILQKPVSTRELASALSRAFTRSASDIPASGKEVP